MKKFIFIFLTFIRTTSQDEVVPRIMDGSPAYRGQFPYMAFITNGLISCGASIIHKRWLLTAAHCELPVPDSWALIGTVYRNGWQGMTVGFEKFIPHKSFAVKSTRILNDVGLIRLDVDLVFDDGIKPIELARDASNDYANVMATLSGWGYKDVVKAEIPEILQFARVEVISEKECTKLWRTAVSKKICTSGRIFQENKETFCNGDSGSPLVFNNKQIGIASYVGAQAGSYLPDVSTRVASYVPWIEKQLKLYFDKLES